MTPVARLQTGPDEPPARAARTPLRARLPAGWLPALLVLMIAAIVLLAPGATRDAARTSVFGADSYARIINEGFIPLNWIVRVDDPVTGAPAVALSREAQSHEEVLAFVRGSYLGGDIVATDSDLWQFDGNRLRGINPNAHNLRDPFAWLGRWEGGLGFRDLVGNADDLGDPYLISSRNTQILLSANYIGRDRIDEAGIVNIETGLPSGDTRRGFEFTEAGGEMLARLRMVGNRPVLAIRCDAGRSHDVRITAAGAAARSCRPADPEEEAPRGDFVTYPLADEDRVVFRMRGSPAIVLSVQLAYGRSLISRYRPFGPRLFGGDQNLLARDIAQAMDWAAALQGPGGDLATTNVALTLDQQFQFEVNNALTLYADELLTQLGRDDEDLFPGAATVMDATNGELLALASYPSPARLEDRWEARASSLARNQNFVALPIGSAAKVPIAAAILGRFPDLRNLCVSGTMPDTQRKLRIHEVLGVALPDSIGDTVAGGQVDFDRFLRNSSNRFGAALILLASAQTGPTGPEDRFTPVFSGRPWALEPHDTFSLHAEGEPCPGSRRYAGVPRYLFLPTAGNASGARLYRGADGLPQQLRDVQGNSSWIDWLQHGFGMWAVAGEARPTPFDPMVWRPLLGAEPDPRLERYFAGISPDRERFGLGSVRKLRDYMMVMLGGGNARWTTIKLAEAYARIAMAREINARLVRREVGITQTPPFWRLPPGARQAVMRGMRQAADPRLGGTASALGAAAQALPVPGGQQIRIFAKTGTPGLEEPLRSRLNRLVNVLIQSRILTMSGGRLVVAANRGEAAGPALARLSADRRLAYASGDTAAIMGRIEAINQARAHGSDGGLIFNQAEQLVGIRPDRVRRREDEQSEGGVAVFVIGRYCSHDVDSVAPLRALSIAINVQARTQIEAGGRTRSGPNPAVRLATRLLARDSAVAAWLRADGEGAATCSG